MTARTVPLAGLGIVIAQISINLGAALGKGLFALVAPAGVAALRTSIAAIILLLLGRAWRARPSSRLMPWLVLYGLSLGGMNLLIYWAIQRIPIGLAVAIEILGPLAVVLFTSRSVQDLLWFALALTGLLLLAPWPGSTTRVDLIGVAFALGAAACWALYILFGKRVSQIPATTAVALGMAIACLLTVPAGLAASGSRLLDGVALRTGALVAVLSSAFPYYLEMRALELLSTRAFGVVTSSAPAIAALVGFLVLGETLTVSQWLAIAAMIVASAGCSLTSKPVLAHASDDVMS